MAIIIIQRPLHCSKLEMKNVVIICALCLGMVSSLSSPESECVESYLRTHSFRGSVQKENSEEYNDTLTIDNKRVVVFPSLVLVPISEEDVAIAVSAVRSCNLSISVMSGGHSAAGYCLSQDGVTLNMRDGMNRVETLSDNTIGGRVRVESGALWNDVYTVTNETDYLPVGGGCTTVGAGFILGGGWSFLSRSYGLGSDNVLSFRMVLANGTIVTASREINADIYWTLGAGGGNFGVVTSFVLQTHAPRSEEMLVGELCWEPFDDVIPELWAWWLEQWSNWPSWMDIEPAWLLISPESSFDVMRKSFKGQGNSGSESVMGSNESDPRMFCFTVICNGDPWDECAEFVDPIKSKYPPVIDSVLPQPFMQWQMANVDVTDAQEGFLYLTSGILPPGALTIEIVSKLIDALHKAPSPRNLVLFHPGGGEIASKSRTSSAFVHRDLELVIQIKGIWSDEKDEDENIAWVQSTRAIVEPYLTGSYINYIDPLLENWQQMYYAENYPKLLDIKAKLDPSNFFQFNQSIGK